MHKYLRFWYFFLLGAILSVTAANLYLKYFAIPQYSISSTLLIKEGSNQPSVSVATSLGDERTGTTRNINDEIQILKSNSLMQKAINELYLNIKYQVKNPLKNREIYGSDLPLKVINIHIDSTIYNQSFAIHIKSDSLFTLSEPTGQTHTYRFGQQINKSYGTFSMVSTLNSPFSTDSTPKDLIVTFLDSWKVAEHYNRILSVLSVNKDANVLSLSFTDPIPKRGENIMNKLLEVYNKEALEDKNLLAANTLTFLDERLKRITVALSGVEKNEERYKRANEVTNVNTQASNYLDQASNYDKKLSEWAVQINVLESIENYLNKDVSQYKMVPSTLGLQDQTLLELITKFNNLQLERERVLRTAHANNPIVQNMNEQLSNLRINILENLKNIKNGLIITRQNLQAISGQFQDRIKKVPSIERNLLEISRQQTTKQNLYLYLLQKREEAALLLAATIAKAKIIDSATASTNPVSPNRNLMYLMALLFGFGLPFTVIYAKDRLNDKIQTKQDVEYLTATPILGEVAHSSNKRETVVVTKNNFSPIAEMFGLVRAHLITATNRKANKVLLVTSSMSGEGKTFFTINLGASLALTGKKVVVLELDFRAPNLLDEVGLPDGVGIADYLLSDSYSIADIISPVDKIVNLYVAGTGVVPLNPTELMTSDKLSYLINELKVSFDHIIIDTAPIGLVADAFSLSGLIDATIYLIRFNYTLKTQVEFVNNIYKNKTLPNPLIVLNDATQQNGSGYGYGYGQIKKKFKKPVSYPR